jgi:hypothetical protein
LDLVRELLLRHPNLTVELSWVLLDRIVDGPDVAVGNAERSWFP